MSALAAVDLPEETGHRPLVIRLLKRLALAFGAVVLAFTALGIVLPRDLLLERRYDVAAPVEVVAAEVNDLSRWQGWAFGEEAQGCVFVDASAAALRWRCGDVDGALLRTDLSEQGLWVDARVAGAIEDVRMKLSLAPTATGTSLRWQEQARAPRVLGAWLRPWLERARLAQIDTSVERLRARLRAAPPGGA